MNAATSTIAPRKAAGRPVQALGGSDRTNPVPPSRAAAMAVLAVDFDRAAADPSWRAESDPATWDPAVDSFYFSAV